jgi:amidohydrolase
VQLARASKCAPDFGGIIQKYRPDLESYEKLYKNLHQHPGLSLQESLAAKVAAAHLRSLKGFTVREKIGGEGLIGILENGEGKTIILRADTDALPVEELTGLPYASKVRQVDVRDKVEKPVMHACGHDMHITCMLAAASTLYESRKHWSGTLVILFQPAEEGGDGAKSMVKDGLYDPEKHACPLPDVVLGQHVMPYPAGSLGSRRGAFASAADSYAVTLYGRGGHASQPHRTVDPVVIAANVIIRLQTVVSREVDPKDTAVVTVGSVHAGMAENIIPDFAVIKINVRTVQPETRDRVLAAIKRIVKAECEASNSPKEPLWETLSHLPFLINDDATVRHLEVPFAAHFGSAYTTDLPHLGGSEDFAILATEAPNKTGGKGVPYAYWAFGGTDPEKWKEAEKKGTLDSDIPINHSAKFAPVIHPTMETGVDALVVAALSFLT